MNRFLPFSLLVLATACGTTRSLQSSESSRVEVRTEVRTVHDTAFVELPVIVERVATLDTASVLENQYARSEAAVASGVLRHSLETKPMKVPVQVETREIVRDSLVYLDKVITETVEVEKKLSWWQNFKMKTGGCTLILIALAILYLFLFKLNLLKLKAL